MCSWNVGQPVTAVLTKVLPTYHVSLECSFGLSSVHLPHIPPAQPRSTSANALFNFWFTFSLSQLRLGLAWDSR